MAKQQDSESILKWTGIVTTAIAALIVDYFVPGWGRPVLFTVAIFGAIVAYCRKWWGVQFWLTTLAALALHIAVTLRYRAVINEVPMVYLFAAAVGEILILAIAFSLAVPEKSV